MIDWPARYEKLMEELSNLDNCGNDTVRSLAALAAEIREGIAAGLLANEEQAIPYVPEPLALLRPIGVAAFRETFDDGDARPAPFTMSTDKESSMRTSGYEPDGRPFRRVPIGCVCPLNARTCPHHGAAPAPPAFDRGLDYAFEPDCRECPHSYALHNDLAGCAALESGDGCECPNSKAILRQ
jgi:hypothetical protein